MASVTTKFRQVFLGRPSKVEKRTPSHCLTDQGIRVFPHKSFGQKMAFALHDGL